MLVAIKENREYKVTDEKSKKHYLDMGYSIVEVSEKPEVEDKAEESEEVKAEEVETEEVEAETVETEEAEEEKKSKGNKKK